LIFSSVNWPDLLHIEQLAIEDAEPLKVEQESFLNAIADKTKRPEVTGAEGPGRPRMRRTNPRRRQSPPVGKVMAARMSRPQDKRRGASPSG
jgi:hypothetical protein